jgi:ABC-2 type transport system ATP-binding protein
VPEEPPAGEPSPGEPPALEFAGLYKRFGDNVAVDRIDLTVPRGSFFGLVGPNGAATTSGAIRSGPRRWPGCCRTAWPCRTA